MLNLPVDQLKPHPRQSEFFKPLEGKAWEEFYSDINLRGIVQPVIISDRTDEWVIADGHQRVRAAKHLGLVEVPCIVMTFENEPQEVQCLVMNNARRRQLSREEIDAVIGYWLKHYPRHSNKRIADEIGVDDKTVEVKRQRMESTSEIPKFDKLEGKDGKLRPRSQPKRPAPRVEPTEEPEEFDAPVLADRVREEIIVEQPTPPGWQPTETHKALERVAKLILSIDVADAWVALGREPRNPASLRLQLLAAHEQLMEFLEVEQDEKVITVGNSLN